MICAVCCTVLVQKVFFIGFSSNSPRWVGGALQKKTATNHLFCLHLVRYVLSDCCMSCFVLSSWSHIDVCGVVKLCTVVCACVAGALEEKTAICIVLCLLLVQHVLSTPPVQEKSAGFRSPPFLHCKDPLHLRRFVLHCKAQFNLHSPFVFC